MAKRRYRDLEDDTDEDRPRARRGESRAPLTIAVVCLLVGLLGGGGFLGYWLLVVRPKHQLQTKGDQLVGKWSGNHPDNPRRTILHEFRKDGSFVLTASEPGVGKVIARGTWKVLSAKGNTLRVLMTTEKREVLDDRGNPVPGVAQEDKQDFKQDIELLSKDRFRLTTSKGRVVEATRIP